MSRRSVRRDLPDLLEAAGLTGRGGAGFPAGRKVSSAQANKADLIVNGCDGELGAGKDAYVLTAHLAEVAAAAAAITSGSVRYAVHRGTDVHDSLRAAGVPVLEVPHRYVSSEETSLISLAHGGLARPMTKWAPFVFGGTDSAGRKIKPTVVMNAESVWRVGQILRNGPQWFRSVGLPTEPGPRLVTIGGTGSLGVPVDMVTGRSELTQGGVFETRSGVSFGELLDAAGAVRRHTRAVLVGGLAGGWLTAEDAWSAQWSNDSLSRFGASLGPGVVTVLHGSECPVCLVGAMLDFATGETAGQCGPCMFGVPALAGQWRALADGDWLARARVEHRLSLLPGRGACRFPDGVARFASSSLRVFGPELAVHAPHAAPSAAVGAEVFHG